MYTCTYRILPGKRPLPLLHTRQLSAPGALAREITVHIQAGEGLFKSEYGISSSYFYSRRTQLRVTMVDLCLKTTLVFVTLRSPEQTVPSVKTSNVNTVISLTSALCKS